jgi:DNA (cytosine-5)-methyltransferase 1
MGYHRAGFEVVGVDIKPQKNYPFQFHRADAMAVLHSFIDRGKNAFLGTVDEWHVIHASPPCQRYSVASKGHNGKADTHSDLIGPTRDALNKIGAVWVIENVMGAPLQNAIILCGTAFPGLRVLRHRQFESNIPLVAPKCKAHPLCYTMDKRKPHYGKLDEMTNFVMVNGGGNCSKAAASDAMGIDWMTKVEMNEAIPPAYTEYIGRQLIEYLNKV